MSDASLDAMANFLSLGLNNYAVDLAPDDREYAVYEAIRNLATKPLPPGDAAAETNLKTAAHQLRSYTPVSAYVRAYVQC